MSTLLAALVVMGMALSLHDVAINAEDTALERDSGRALMGQLQSMFSVGAMAGAALAAMLLRLGWPAPMQFAVVGGARGSPPRWPQPVCAPTRPCHRRHPRPGLPGREGSCCGSAC